jgi:DNA-binding MarR family transcriptional regulator
MVPPQRATIPQPTTFQIETIFGVDRMVKSVGIFHSMRTITSTTDLEDEIIANFREAFAELRCLGSERMHRADMSMSHFHLMSMLDRHGSMTMSRIAELLGVSVSNATGLIDRIEERGLVERTRVPEDRRVVHVQLTDKGRQTLHEVELFKEDMIHGILNRLDERQLRRVAMAMSDLRAAVVDELSSDPSVQLHQHVQRVHGSHGASSRTV